jgi:hypothetical protein
MIFACDVNLGFPTDDPECAAFFRDHGWRTVSYDDMGMLTATLKAHQPAAAFMPAANYYYLKDDPSRRATRSDECILASANFAGLHGIGYRPVQPVICLRLSCSCYCCIRGQQVRHDRYCGVAGFAWTG